MAIIVGSNYKEQDEFAFMHTNPDMQWYPESLFEEKTKIPAKDGYNKAYYDARSMYWAKQIADYKGGKGLGVEYRQNFDFIPNRPINNIFKNKDSWIKLDKMINGSEKGALMSFDTETIGNFSEYFLRPDDIESRMAGITEIAYDIHNFGGSKSRMSPGSSFFFGIDSEQKQWLLDVLEKKKRGEELTSTEASAMERASRHSTIVHDGHSFKTSKRAWSVNNKTYTFVDELNISNPNSDEDILSGIEAMAREYSGERNQQIEDVFGYIKRFSKDESHVIAGQNLKYDINVGNVWADLHGGKGFDPNLQYVDTADAIQMLAKEQGISTGEFLKRVNPNTTQVSGTLGSILEAISPVGFETGEFHNAFFDSNSVSIALLNKQLNIPESVVDILNNKGFDPSQNLKDAYIKINAKGQIRGKDFLIANTKNIDNAQITTSYAVPGSVMRFSGAADNVTLSGLSFKTPNGEIIDLKDEAKGQYVLKFDAIDNDDISLFKVFDSQEERDEWLDLYTNIIKDPLEAQQEQSIHNKDVARRIIDGFYDPGQASGYNGFKKYYQAYKELASLSEDAVSSIGINGVKTSNDLIKNIRYGSNFEKILEYADNNGLESLSDLFVAKPNIGINTVEQRGVHYYKDRYLLTDIFETFNNNKEFYDYAESIIDNTSTDNNFIKTLMFKKLTESYKESNVAKPSLIMTTLKDLNSVSILTGDNKYSFIDVTENDNHREIYKFINAVKSKYNESANVTTKSLTDSVNNLVERGLLSKVDKKELVETYSGAQSNYYYAQAIMRRLEKNTQLIRDNGLEQYKIDYAAAMSVPDEELTITQRMIKQKNHKTLLESSVSEMQNITTGLVNDDVKQKAPEILETAKNIIIKNGSLKSGEEEELKVVQNVLYNMGYEKSGIDRFSDIFHVGGKYEFNLAKINKDLKQEGLSEVVPIFYKSGIEKDSAFLIFTQENKQKRIISVLDELGNDATASQVKKAIRDEASYFEIPFIERIALDTDPERIAKNKMYGFVGHSPEIAIAHKGSMARTLSHSIEIYTKDVQGKTIIHGRLNKQGDEFVSSIRPFMRSGITATSKGDYSSATRTFNNYIKKAMMDEGSISEHGGFDVDDSFKVIRNATVSDITSAYSINVDALKDITALLASNADVTVAENKNAIYTRALSDIITLFNEDGNVIFNKRPEEFNVSDIRRIIDNDNFKQFYGENLTRQTGGIASNDVIARYIEENADSTLARLQHASLIDIINGAVQESPLTAEDLKKTIQGLANSGLQTATSISNYHKDTIFMDDLVYDEYYGSPTASPIRPNTAQRGNVRTYTKTEANFRDIEGLENTLGIKFGDTSVSERYRREINAYDKYLYGAENVTQKSIVGTVESISDTELVNLRNDALAMILSKNKDLEVSMDEKILKRMFNEIYSGINLYEGKGYLRPSLGNQPFMYIEDPKTWSSQELLNIFEHGTEEEKRLTREKLDSLVGQKIKNGDTVGYRLRSGSTDKFDSIIYRGKNISSLTQENIEEIIENGKTIVNVDKQLDSGKLFANFEKFTYSTYNYFNGTTEEEQLLEIQEKMRSLGFKDSEISNSLTENISTMNKYSDFIFDYIGNNQMSKHKTIAFANLNVEKHVTDLSVESMRNIIDYEFGKSEDAFNTYKSILLSSENYRLIDFANSITYNAVNSEIVYDNFEKNGTINVFDDIVNELRKHDLEEANNVIREMEYFSEFNGAFIGVQRQQMNVFEGEAFKMDQRTYQGLYYQTEMGFGGEHGEVIRNRIMKGWYDKNIPDVAKGKHDALNSTWKEIVRDRRGILRPLKEQEQLVGITESLSFIEKDLSEQLNHVNTKNIIKISTDDILKYIPKSGANGDELENLIFKVNGKVPDFMKSFAKTGNNNVLLNANSSSFYLDFGRIVKYDNKEIRGILLPFQNISDNFGEKYVSESTKDVISLLNTLKRLDDDNKLGSSVSDAEISKALNKLFNSFAEETNISNKDSLATKALMKAKMPNSYGAKAMDAIVPTLNFDIENDNGERFTIDKFRRLKEIENKIANGSLNINNVKELNELNSLYDLRKSILEKQKSLIDSAYSFDEYAKALNLTGDKKYVQYLVGENNTVIENAVIMSKNMFKNTEMDPGIIGRQILTDYFSGNKLGIKKYDSLSTFTGAQFHISNKDFDNIMNVFHDTFSKNGYEDFAYETKRAINKVLNGGYSKDEEHKRIVGLLNNKVNKLMSETSNIEERKNISYLYDKAAEKIGEKYLKEVGVLGEVTRYPVFSEFSELPVRAYLDDGLKGNTVRLLGPQFSILQNVDFDGDDEFIRLFGNGGLLSKKDEEYKLFKDRLQYLNKHNKEIFKDSIEDSLKTYRYSDTSSYRASLLKAFDKDSYDLAKKEFEEAIGSGLERYNSYNENVQEFLVNHSIQMKKYFRNFDEVSGISMMNPKIVKAALAAIDRKDFIGNYSKPNLEIRNTLASLFENTTDVEQIIKLKRIKESLSYITEENVLGGILNDLEQKGIDTKHVKDAIELNRSSEWRKGVRGLFSEIKKPSVANYIREQNVAKMVTGSRRIYFSELKENDLAIAKSIMNTSLEDLNEQLKNATDETRDALLGKRSIRGIYELSQMDGAISAYNDIFRKASRTDIEQAINDLKDIRVGKKDLSSAAISTWSSLLKKYGTDDIFSIDNRQILEGDILAFTGKNNEPYGLVFENITKEKGKFVANFKQFDLEKGIEAESKKRTKFRGVTIKELNEQIKRRGPIDYVNKTNNRNINIRDLANTVTVQERNKLLHSSIGEELVYNNLNIIFKTGTQDSIDAAKNISFVPTGYNSNTSIGKTIGKILGDDTSAKTIQELRERLNYGLSKGYITGFDSADSLITSINREIAKNPRQNVNRISGYNLEQLITNYLGENNKLYGSREWLKDNIDDLKSYRVIQNKIGELSTENEKQISDIALGLYGSIKDKSVNEKELFEKAKALQNKKIYDMNQNIFGLFNKSNDPMKQMLKSFNYETLTTNNGFIIDPSSVKINSGISQDILNAKVGYGRFIGTKLEDLSSDKVKYILENELNDNVLKSFKNTNSVEYAAAANTRTLLNAIKGMSTATDTPYAKFDSVESIKAYGKSVEDNLDKAAEELFEDVFGMSSDKMEDFIKDFTTPSGKTKTLKSRIDIDKFFKTIPPDAKKGLAIGGAVVGGLAIAGMLGHSFLQSKDSGSVEVPISIERPSQPRYKNDLGYPNESTQAESTSRHHRRKKLAPPSINIKPLESRTIYHDANSGFNFKVSANTKNKLTSQSYNNIARSAGSNNNSLFVSKDNSKITNNWLETKFSELME